jgi:hypothetical protein
VKRNYSAKAERGAGWGERAREKGERGTRNCLIWEVLEAAWKVRFSQE